MNAITNINAFNAMEMEIPNIETVMTRVDWEKEYEEEFKEKCKVRLRRYFKWKARKIYVNAIKIIIATAIFYGVMSIIALFVEFICRYVWV